MPVLQRFYIFYVPLLLCSKTYQRIMEIEEIRVIITV